MRRLIGLVKWLLMVITTPKGKMSRIGSVDVFDNFAKHKEKKIYIVLISLHGLIRGENMELGRRYWLSLWWAGSLICGMSEWRLEDIMTPIMKEYMYRVFRTDPYSGP